MSDQIADIVIPILKQLQGDLAAVKTDVSVLKENTGMTDLKLKSVEAHMSGFMSSARYFEAEIDMMRGRVEALENDKKPDA